MPRIPYADADATYPAPLVEAIRKRRGGKLLHLDRMLLHSPPFAEGWNEFLGKVRHQLSLAPRLLELAICVIAIENKAVYELTHHQPLFAAAGATPEQLAALPNVTAADPDLSMFEPVDRTVITVTLELTRGAAVSDATFAEARRHFPDDRQLVELVGTIAAYNMVSRFLTAFDIKPEP